MSDTTENTDTQQTAPEPVTIDSTSEDVAAGVTAEDTARAYDALFNQLRGENDKLAKANRSLQAQIGILLRNGASVGDTSQAVNEPGQDQANEPEPPSEPYVSLADLGAEIGKRDYATHNTQRD